MNDERLGDVGDEEIEDAWMDSYSRLDIKLSQRIAPGIKIFLDGLNLTNAPETQFIKNAAGRKYELEREKYGAGFMLGINLEL